MLACPRRYGGPCGSSSGLCGFHRRREKCRECGAGGCLPHQGEPVGVRHVTSRGGSRASMLLLRCSLSVLVRIAPRVRLDVGAILSVVAANADPRTSLLSTRSG